jgi:hypothetical protein
LEPGASDAMRRGPKRGGPKNHESGRGPANLNLYSPHIAGFFCGCAEILV